ncbi:putative pentatricopeptide repeat-containing protein, mitochondrial [Ananas comosus]|uniref:Putative pentatricopeptide repeat-containing protein, mitochondrial n=1 Tax=Ananas comosus TaxID=4615 RepID=A0A199UG49_ANACO|nr:putative pentatricopeptide repeat-containing protein, mitochondrial [Ananas comosus]
MSLRALRITHLFPPPKPYHFIFNLRPISSSSSSSSPFEPSLTSNPHARHLFDLFSQPRHLRDAAELGRAGRLLSGETAEVVLRSLAGWRAADEFFRWAAWQPGFHHTCYTYNAMAHALSRARQPGRLKNLAAEVVARRCPMTPGALGFLIRCLGALGLVEEAEHVFDHAGDLNCVPNSYTYNCLLEVLGKAGRVESSETRLREMMQGLGREPDKYTLTSVLQCYCNAGKFDAVLKTFNNMNERGWVDEHVLTVLIVTFCKWGKVESVFELFDRMTERGVKPSERTFSVLIHGFVRQGRLDKAVEMFDKMKDSGFIGDLRIYSVLIEGLCQGKDLRRALDLYMDMKRQGISPDVRLLKKMISAFCGENDLVGIGRLFEENKEILSSSSCVALFNAILDGLVNQGDVDRAHSLLRVMIESVGTEVPSSIMEEPKIGENEATLENLFNVKRAVIPNSDSFNIVICGLCEVKKLDTALTLVNDMVGLGRRGKLLMFNNLILELCTVNRLDEAYEIFGKMKELGIVPTEFTYNSLFYGLCRRKDSIAALDLLREMRSEGHVPWIKHCTTMVKELCMNGEVAKASEFLSDLLKAGFIPDLVAYSAAIDGMCKNGEVDKALALFRDISSNFYLPDVVAHNIIINGLCKAGRLTEAQDILQNMLEKGLIPSVITYNLMINNCCRADKIEGALAFFNKMIDEERAPTVVTYTSLIDGLCSAGRAEDALVIWDEMRDKGCFPNNITYTALIHGLCKCARPDVALTYYNEMVERGIELDKNVHLLLINSLILKGNTTKAFELLKEILSNNFHSTSPKQFELMKKAVHKLYRDERTYLDTRMLIEGGSVPMIDSVSDLLEDVKK